MDLLADGQRSTRYLAWRGHEIKNYETLLQALVRVENKAEAQEFLLAYEAVNHPHARENIGWAVGDLNREQGRRVMELFECPHPVFGTTYPTAEEAFRLGMESGEKLLSGQNPLKNPNPWFVGALDE
jgi:hypothetical protein